MEDLDFEHDVDLGIDGGFDSETEMPSIGDIDSPFEDGSYYQEDIDSDVDNLETDSDILHTNEGENKAHVSHGEVSFKGYTQSEIDNKYHKAEMEYGHAKADYQRHMDLAKTGTMPNNDELAHARDAYRRMETAQKEMYKWKYTHPDKK